MFGQEPPQPKSIVDQLISLGIAAVCGFLLGKILGHFSVMIFERSFGLVWISTIGFSVFGFAAPAESRALWTRVWSFILEFAYKLIDTRRFYR